MELRYLLSSTEFLENLLQFFPKRIHRISSYIPLRNRSSKSSENQGNAFATKCFEMTLFHSFSRSRNNETYLKQVKKVNVIRNNLKYKYELFKYKQRMYFVMSIKCKCRFLRGRGERRQIKIEQFIRVASMRRKYPQRKLLRKIAIS